MSQFTDAQLAAAALADRYIEIILTTKPELLIPGPAIVNDDRGPNGQSQMHQAQRITYFRSMLISQLENQSINFESLDD